MISNLYSFFFSSHHNNVSDCSQTSDAMSLYLGLVVSDKKILPHVHYKSM